MHIVYLVKRDGIIVKNSLSVPHDNSRICITCVEKRMSIVIRYNSAHELRICDDLIRKIYYKQYTINNEEFNSYVETLLPIAKRIVFDECDQSELLCVFDECMRYTEFFGDFIYESEKQIEETLNNIRTKPRCKSANF